MSSEFLAQGFNKKITGLTSVVDLESVAVADTVEGNPVQGTLELGTIAGAEVGIWELREGTVTDTEVDEFFVVIAGAAIVEFLDDSANVSESVTLIAGDVMRLAAGSKTRWIVPDFIRKVYIA